MNIIIRLSKNNNKWIKCNKKMKLKKSGKMAPEVAPPIRLTSYTRKVQISPAQRY